MIIKGVKYVFFGILLQCIYINANAQIPDFSQSHTNYIYSNPAFAGIKNCPHAYTSYRSRYSSVDGGYSTNFISFDMYVSAFKSDIAAYIIHDIQNSVYYSTMFQGIYAKEFQLRKKLFFKTAMALGMVQSKIQTNNLIFSDMLNPFSNVLEQTEEDISAKNTINFTVEPAFLVYSDKFFGGVSIKHIQANIIKKRKEDYLLQRVVSLYAGTEFSTTKAFTKRYLVLMYPYVNVTISDLFSYTQIGMIAQKGRVQFGGGYRQNLPLDAESFEVFVGFFEKKFKFAYNCDISINSYITNNCNSHEVSLSYDFDCMTKRKKYEAVKAPMF